MKWHWIAILLVCGAPALCAQEAAPAPARPEARAGSAVEAAEAALEARLPDVAIARLQAFLAADTAVDDVLHQRAESDLTRAMLDAGDAAGALARLEYPATGEERFWKAEALSALGRWDEAQGLYADVVAEGPAALQAPAALGEAEALHAMDRTPEAIGVLAALDLHSVPALVPLRLADLCLENQQPEEARRYLAAAKPATTLETRWRQYVEGRILLAEDQAVPAVQDFEEVLKDPHGLTAALEAGATIGLTEGRVVLSGLETADNVIEDYISHHPESSYLDEMFRRLDRIYAAEDNPSDTELQRWASRGASPRAALALYYEARMYQREGRPDRAIRAYTDFIQRYPRNACVFEAWMQLGQLYLHSGRIPAAVSAFEGAMRSSSNPGERARAEIASGNAYFAQGEFLLAQETFRNAAQHCPDVWLEATYDSALAWLHVGNYDRFLEDYTALSQRNPETEQRRDLLLEEGLLQARSGDARAAATLEEFIREFPDNRRVPEARLALAELVYATGEMDSANDLLQAAYVSEPAEASREQADYLAVFIADSDPKRDDDHVLELGRRFLDTYPASALRPQVRMKLGQVYFRRQDFANAQTQFETLAQESPADPLADQALILAGQSSVASMSAGGVDHALALFDRAAKGNGPLSLYARQEQAVLEARLGHCKEAVLIYDDILRSNPDAQLRLAALCGKADCLVAAATPAGSSSPAPAGSPAAQAFADAISLYDQVAAEPDAAAHWRDQALYKKARCLSREGQAGEALATLYDIISERPAAARQQPDFVWFEKAGYDAAAALESKAQWSGAIAVLEKVAAAGGPRSDEARKRAEQLRLEHFVWD